MAFVLLILKRMNDLTFYELINSLQTGLVTEMKWID